MIRKKLLFLVLGISFLGIAIFLPFSSFAQIDNGVTGALNTQLGAAKNTAGFVEKPVQQIIAEWIANALTLLGIIFLVLIIFAGFTWMTSGGEEEKVRKAQGLLRNSIIGLLIILSAYAITKAVTYGFIQATTGQGQTQGTGGGESPDGE